MYIFFLTDCASVCNLLITLFYKHFLQGIFVTWLWVFWCGLYLFLVYSLTIHDNKKHWSANPRRAAHYIRHCWAGLLVCVYSRFPAVARRESGYSSSESRDTRPPLWLLVPPRYTERADPVDDWSKNVQICNSCAFSPDQKIVEYALAVQCWKRSSFGTEHFQQKNALNFCPSLPVK